MCIQPNPTALVMRSYPTNHTSHANNLTAALPYLLTSTQYFQAPVDFVKSKPVRRIFLPKLVNPNYNYIGLIIGPRGNTQKQLEQETGTCVRILQVLIMHTYGLYTVCDMNSYINLIIHAHSKLLTAV